MHKHDQDLIAALAEGTLDTTAAAVATADIAGCSTCSADLAAQRVAITAIAGALPVAMTATESARLRSAVASAIGIEPSATPVPVSRSKRSPWGAIAIAAASLAGIIGVVPVLGLLSQGGDDSAATTAAAVAIDAPENDATSQQREVGFLEETAGLEGTEMDSAAPTEADLAGGTATPPTAETTSPTITAAATTTPIEDAPPTAFALTGEDAVRELFAAGPKAEYLAYGEQVDRKDLACSGAAESELGNEPFYVDVPATLDDGRMVVLYTDAGWTKLVAFDTTDCELALVLP